MILGLQPATFIYDIFGPFQEQKYISRISAEGDLLLSLCFVLSPQSALDLHFVPSLHFVLMG